MLVTNDTGDGWPFIRAAKFCPICQAEKPGGKIVCDTCRTTKTFLSMTRQLTNAEMGMRWNAERSPDRLVPPRATDPKLGRCQKCGGSDAAFMRFEVPGKIVGYRVTANVEYYVICNGCRAQTLPRKTKKLVAEVWSRGDVFFK